MPKAPIPPGFSGGSARVLTWSSRGGRPSPGNKFQGRQMARTSKSACLQRRMPCDFIPGSSPVCFLSLLPRRGGGIAADGAGVFSFCSRRRVCVCVLQRDSGSAACWPATSSVAPPCRCDMCAAGIRSIGRASARCKEQQLGRPATGKAGIRARKRAILTEVLATRALPPTVSIRVLGQTSNIASALGCARPRALASTLLCRSLYLVHNATRRHLASPVLAQSPPFPG